MTAKGAGTNIKEITFHFLPGVYTFRETRYGKIITLLPGINVFRNISPSDLDRCHLLRGIFQFLTGVNDMIHILKGECEKLPWKKPWFSTI